MTNETRHSVVLNIGLLNNPWGKLPPEQFAQRIAERAVSYFDGIENSLVEVAYFADWYTSETSIDTHDSDHVTEPTAVVRFDTGDFDRETFEQNLLKLANLLTQGAIAYECRRANGKRPIIDAHGLVGPKTDDWGGAFDHRYFEDGSALALRSDHWATAFVPYADERERMEAMKHGQ